VLTLILYAFIGCLPYYIHSKGVIFTPRLFALNSVLSILTYLGSESFFTMCENSFL